MIGPIRWMLLFGPLALTVAIHAGASDKFGLTTDITYASKYLTDGFSIGGDNPVIEPSIDFKLFSSGFSLMFWTAQQLNRSNQSYDELDFFLRYSHTFFSNAPSAINLHGFWDFWYFPKSRTEYRDWYGNTVEIPNLQGHKINAGVSLPKIFPLGGSYVVPTYNLNYWLYWAENRRDRYQGGAHHELLLYYDHSIPAFVPGAVAQYVGLTGSLNYNDGAFGVRPGFSHTTAQLATSIHALGLIFTGAINRQWSHQVTVNPNNEIWSTLSVTKKM